MNKKVLCLMVVCCILTGMVAACTQDTGRSGEVEYKIIALSDLKDEALKQWYEDSYKKEGSHSASIGDGFKYLLICAGERPTGGYSIEVTKVVKEEDEIVFYTRLNVPGKEEAVIQAITYPHLLLRVKAEDTQTVKAKLEVADESGQNNRKKVLGIYVGQIDNNSIEIEIDGQPKAFWLDDKVKSVFEKDKYQKGDKVFIEYHNDKHDRPVICKIAKHD